MKPKRVCWFSLDVTKIRHWRCLPSDERFLQTPLQNHAKANHTCCFITSETVSCKHIRLTCMLFLRRAFCMPRECFPSVSQVPTRCQTWYCMLCPCIRQNSFAFQREAPDGNKSINYTLFEWLYKHTRLGRAVIFGVAITGCLCWYSTPH